MAVLETMAGINAAYAIIKSTIENGRELSSCAQAIGKFASGQTELEKIHQAKSNSLWVKLAGTDASDLETFMHKEKVKRMENNLREYMQLYGRGGMWGDYQKYCAEARKDRARAVRRPARHLPGAPRRCQQPGGRGRGRVGAGRGGGLETGDSLWDRAGMDGR